LLDPEQNINIFLSPENNDSEQNQNIITTEKEKSVVIIKKNKVFSEEIKTKTKNMVLKLIKRFLIP
jgi:hypothetical protein